ncbi:hypothetical protein BH11MYX1_BH11MYX1_45350 [soil metagenome]
MGVKNNRLHATLAVVLMIVPTLASAEKVFNTEKTGTWDCGKDATVVINKSTGKYTLTGACKEITINGGHLTVAIESVGTLSVNGSDSTITTDKLDSGSVSGSNNKITWKTSGGAGGKPEVSALGQNNAITRAK